MKYTNNSLRRLEYNSVSNAFTVSEISTVIGVNGRTVKRRLNELGITIRDTYSHLSTAELDNAIERPK